MLKQIRSNPDVYLDDSGIAPDRIFVAEAVDFDGEVRRLWHVAGSTGACEIVHSTFSAAFEAPAAPPRPAHVLNGKTRAGRGKKTRQIILSGPPATPPTRAEVMAARTGRGGWSAQTLAAWGVAWPPRTGWIDRLCSGKKP